MKSVTSLISAHMYDGRSKMYQNPIDRKLLFQCKYVPYAKFYQNLRNSFNSVPKTIGKSETHMDILSLLRVQFAKSL
jgi:hypothetical protein